MVSFSSNDLRSFHYRNHNGTLGCDFVVEVVVATAVAFVSGIATAAVENVRPFFAMVAPIQEAGLT
jgi:hypothetical protein